VYVCSEYTCRLYGKISSKPSNLLEVQLRDESKSFEMNSQYAFAVKNDVILDTSLLRGSRPGNK
jgi:hypothetical protein